jgi:hypothetical protein
MKTYRTVMLALFAVFAFSAVLAASASAEEVTLLAEWLINGAAVTTLTSVSSTGALELTDNKTAGGAATVLCEGTLDGSVGPNGEDEITEVLNLASEKVGTELIGVALLCTRVSLCEAGTDIELWPDNLPWLTLLNLMTTAPEFLVHLFKDSEDSNTAQPGWELKCLVLGIPLEDLCLGLTSFAVENITGSVLSLFDPAAPISSEKGDCTQGGVASGEVKGEGLIVPLTGTLTVSSTG